MNKHRVEHQADESLFFINLEEGENAFLRYRLMESLADGGQVDFFSTFVPDSHRGQGLAAQLVEAGFDWAEAEGLTIKTSCWYAAKIMDERQAQS
ncbi:MAG: GNAT family N-acetyltransferase [Pseudomonadota bacterium]